MVLFWRGRGISVLYLFVFWFLATLIYMVATTTYEPDKLKVAMDAQWLFTAMFALIALSVFAVARYRKGRPIFSPEKGWRNAARAGVTASWAGWLRSAVSCPAPP